MKLDKLMRTLKDEKILDSIKADVYTVEFQKIELPHAHPELYELVGSYMVHGPSGRSSRNAPCMKDDKYSKYFPKRYNAHTILDEKGYPTYCRRNDGRTVSRKGVKLDNRFVVPYNARLLKLFCGHLNIEKTNQSRSIKYLFKYISKGNDRAIAGIYNKNDSLGTQQSFDEVSHYLNCSWKDWSLYPSSRRTILSSFVAYKASWRKDLHRYKNVNSVVYPTFREACYALGLLDDDKEYIDAIKEASSWASCNYLCQFFTSMLLSHCLSQPAIVWEHTKGFLCEDLLHISHGDNRFPDNIFDISNQLIVQELNYKKLKEREESEKLQRLMTAEQKQVFDEIMSVVSSKKGGFFFLHGFGRTGKTFIWKALTASDCATVQDFKLHNLGRMSLKLRH
ncbi:hypothetical protein K1719_033644 [Acacia pycnantha]|nr:hypothetical protein K1719_033644 [Acacia pycnantha]